MSKKQQYTNLLVSLMEKHKWKEVGKVCRIFLEKEAECAQAHFFSGIYHKHTKKIDAAKSAFYICIKYDKHYFLSYINLIRILRDENNFIETFELINKAKILFPDNILVYIESSDFYLKVNNINEAIVDIQIAIKINPKSETAQYNYALILNKLYNSAINDDETEHYYRKTLIQYMCVLSINMYNTNALCNYGAVIAKYGDKYYTKADTLLDEYKKLLIENKIKEANEKKDQSDLYYMYGDQYNMEASTKYLQVLDLDPLDYITHFNLGLVLKTFHHLDKAKFHIMKSLEINPEYEAAKHELVLLDEINSK